MHDPDGRDYQNRITFEAVTPPECLTYRHDGGEDVEPVQFKTRVTFDEVEGSPRKTRVVMRMDFPSAAERARVIKEYGADQGVRQTLERLADYVLRTGEQTHAGTAGLEQRA